MNVRNSKVARESLRGFTTPAKRQFIKNAASPCGKAAKGLASYFIRAAANSSFSGGLL